MDTPRVSLIVSTFERPQSLRLVLVSLGLQRGLADDDLEIVVSDDGSSDDTRQVVERFGAECRFAVRFTTHPHDGFQLARTRNDGVRAARAPYLIFLDGDCVAPATHVAQHLRRRRRRTVMGGYCHLLNRETSARVDEAAIARGEFNRWVTWADRRKLKMMDVKARFYSVVPHPRRPKLYGGDIGIWRSDFEAVNGFNEEFTGWGCEDDEFAVRLRVSGIRIRSILRWTRTFHLWHPPVPSYPANWKRGANVKKLSIETARAAPRCVRGLHNPAA